MSKKIEEIKARLMGLDDGAVEIIDIKEKKQDGKDGWQLKYKENNQPGIQKIWSVSREEIEEFSHTFGGRNLETFAADSKFLELDFTWDANDLLRLGHRPTKIKLEGSVTTKNKRVKIDFPPDTGESAILESKKEERDCAILRMKDVEGMKFTRSFSDYTEMNNLIAFIKEEEQIIGLKWYVQMLCTQSTTTKKQCLWVREKAGDGTRRMTLQLDYLDGVKYDKCLRQDLLNAAGGMAITPCQSAKGEKKKPREVKICLWAAEDGKLDLNKYDNIH